MAGNAVWNIKILWVCLGLQGYLMLCSKHLQPWRSAPNWALSCCMWYERRPRRCNFMEQLPPEVVRLIRKLVISMVLKTDMSLHFATISSFKSLIRSQRFMEDGKVLPPAHHRPVLSVANIRMMICICWSAYDHVKQIRHFMQEMVNCLLTLRRSHLDGSSQQSHDIAPMGAALADHSLP